MSSSRAPHAPPIPTPSSTRRVTNAPSFVSGPYAWRRCRHRTPSRTRSEKPLKRVPESRAHFARRVNHALDDPKLQKALIGAMTGLRGRRNAAFDSFDFQQGRAELKRRRQANLDRLPELLEQFSRRLEAVGGEVHIADDAAEAREIIGRICQRAGAGLDAGKRMVVTKSKTMAGEEIALNDYLEGLGMEVVE